MEVPKVYRNKEASMQQNTIVTCVPHYKIMRAIIVACFYCIDASLFLCFLTIPSLHPPPLLMKNTYFMFPLAPTQVICLKRLLTAELFCMLRANWGECSKPRIGEVNTNSVWLYVSLYVINWSVSITRFFLCEVFLCLHYIHLVIDTRAHSPSEYVGVIPTYRVYR